MRFGNRSSFRMSYFFKKKEFQKILKTNIGLNSAEVEEFLDMNKSILNFPRHRFVNDCLICQKYNVNVRPLINFRHCLMLNSHTLEHRINTLKDIGVPDLNSFLVSKMVFLFRKHISMFKEKTKIPVEQNIAKNIFDRLGHEVPSDIAQLELNNKLTLDQYYDACLLHCKTRVFDLPYLDDKILHQYMKFKSISMIAETLKVLRIDLDYNEEMIKKNPFVITASADNIKLLLDSFTDICGVPIIMFLRTYPKILLQDAKNIKRLLMSFKRYEIPDQYVTNFIKVLEMDNDIFLKRMEKIKRHPDLYVWCKHPRILQILVHKKMTNDRIGYLHIMNRSKWLRPQTVLARMSDMDKYLNNISSTGVSRHALKYICMQEIEVDKSNLLTRHPHWKTTGLIDIKKMFHYLKKHFTISEICENIHIVLYPQSKVEKVLADLKQRYSHSTEYSFTNGQYLALCLYMMEKDTHFTGDGIWNGHNVKQSSLLPLENKNAVQVINNDTIGSTSDSSSKYINDDDDDLNTKDRNDMDDHDLDDLDVLEDEISNTTKRQHT